MKSTPRRRLRPALVGHDTCFYHIVSRFVDRRFAFGDEEKRYFLSLMRAYEAFGCLRVVGYCLMSNHFHILVQVCARPTERMAEVELLAHVEATLGEGIAATYREALVNLRRSLADMREAEARAEAMLSEEARAEKPPYRVPVGESWEEKEMEAILGGIWRRMYDVSAFVQMLKQRFTVWYNKRNERLGTLWEERYRSTLIEGGAAVAEIAAYIDLNPVRAGLVDDPKDYRWSQYGAAMAGELLEREAVRRVLQTHCSLPEAETIAWDGLQGRYRVLLYLRGLLRPTAGGGWVGVFDAAEVERVFAAKGHVSGISYAKLRVRYFVDGAIIGSKAYVDRVWGENRTLFGPKRKSGARRMRAVVDAAVEKVATWGELRALRDLRG